MITVTLQGESLVLHPTWEGENCRLILTDYSTQSRVEIVLNRQQLAALSVSLVHENTAADTALAQVLYPNGKVDIDAAKAKWGTNFVSRLADLWRGTPEARRETTLCPDCGVGIVFSMTNATPVMHNYPTPNCPLCGYGLPKQGMIDAWHYPVEDVAVSS